MTDIPESPFAVHAIEVLGLPPQAAERVRELAQVVALTAGDDLITPTHVQLAALMAGEGKAAELAEVWR